MTPSDDDASLDPADWPAFRAAAHRLLDDCIDRLAHAADDPWQPVPDDVKSRYRLPAPLLDAAGLAQALGREVLPYASGNTHPRFFGWVQGTGLASSLLSELAAVTMNSNCGGRDHGAIYMERAVIDWSRETFGFPPSASGVLVSGTSQATVIALAAARIRALGPELRRRGQGRQRLTAYAGPDTHQAVVKAIELLGIGRDQLRLLPGTSGRIDSAALRAAIAADRAAGARPFAIVGTAGSVNLGAFDDLPALAAIARTEQLWLHVDGAFGAWLRLADPPWRRLADGIELADSLACDFHKWMYVPYDCGMVLIRDAAEHRAAFAARPSYLAAQTAGLGGGDPWYCDYGIDLSRGNRALRVWAALRMHGPERLGQVIARNCRLAQRMAERIAAQPRMRLMAPVISNLCVFTADATRSPAEQSAVNARIARELQLDGSAVFSTAEIGGIVCLRAAITNHRTQPRDIDFAIAAVARGAAA